jgi:hypothetical protein
MDEWEDGEESKEGRRRGRRGRRGRGGRARKMIPLPISHKVSRHNVWKLIFGSDHFSSLGVSLPCNHPYWCAFENGTIEGGGREGGGGMRALLKMVLLKEEGGGGGMRGLF